MPLLALSLGSNIDAERNMRRALAALRARWPSLRRSVVYESEAVGFAGADFLNAVVLVMTDDPLPAITSYIASLENELGRQRGRGRFAPRTMDIDVLLYETAPAAPLAKPAQRVPRRELPPALAADEGGVGKERHELAFEKEPPPAVATGGGDLGKALHEYTVGTEPSPATAAVGGDAGTLELPRPDILACAFALQPLAELLPGHIHGPSGRSYGELWAKLSAGFAASGQRLRPIAFDESAAGGR